MADSKITALTAISTVDPTADPLVIVDVSDTSMAASGTTKKSTINQLLGAGGTATLASATITGAASAAGLSVTGSTIPTNGVYLPSANNLGFAYNSTLGMTLNSTGLGVGVTPSAWTLFKAVELPGGSFASLAGQTDLLSNAYYNGAFRFKATGLGASMFDQFDGAFRWYNSTSGAANDPITAFASPKMTLDASGNLLVGLTADSFQPTKGVAANASNSSRISVGHANGTASGDYYHSFAYNGAVIGSITQSGTTGVAFNATSDYRLKEAVAPLTGGLARVSALKPSIYKWKADGSNGEGFLAHELAEVVPAAVSGEKDAVNEDGSIKPQGVDMSRVVPILVAAIQELTARVQTLETR